MNQKRMEREGKVLRVLPQVSIFWAFLSRNYFYIYLKSIMFCPLFPFLFRDSSFGPVSNRINYFLIFPFFIRALTYSTRPGILRHHFSFYSSRSGDRRLVSLSRLSNLWMKELLFLASFLFSSFSHLLLQELLLFSGESLRKVSSVSFPFLMSEYTVNLLSA